MTASMIRHAGCTLVVVMLLAATAGAQFQKPAVRYEGTWNVQPNGDLKIVRKFTVPMQAYQSWKAGGVHMLEARGFSEARSPVVVKDSKAEWDDMNRTLTLTMTVMGMVENKGTHWEGKMEAGEEFSNLDEGKRTAHFHFAADGPLGRVEGQDRVIFPEEATDLKWDAGSRQLQYKMPEVGGGSPAVRWWTLFAVCLALGVVLLGVSAVAGGTAKPGE